MDHSTCKDDELGTLFLKVFKSQLSESNISPIQTRRGGLVKDAADRETDDYKWPYCSARTPHTLTQLMLVSSTRVLEVFFSTKYLSTSNIFWHPNFFARQIFLFVNKYFLLRCPSSRRTAWWTWQRSFTSCGCGGRSLSSATSRTRSGASTARTTASSASSRWVQWKKDHLDKILHLHL